MQQWIDSHRSEWMEDYLTLLRFQSVSADHAYKSQLLACAEWVKDFLKSLDFTIETWETTGHPIVFASNLNAGPEHPTLLIYNHYDVQPVDPLNLWDSPPFEPRICDGNVYARGAQDNKGQLLYVL